MRRLITGGEFPPGKRLPPTRALASRLQISRVTVGELIRQLEAEGLVVAGSERIRFVAGGERPREEVLQPLPAGTIAILSGLPLEYPWATAFPFVHRIQAALVSELLVAGLNPFLMVGGADQARRAADLRPAACVVLDDTFGGDIPDYHPILEPLRAHRIPLVVDSDRMSEDDAANIDCVRCDHHAGAGELVRMLAKRGRRRLVALFIEPMGSSLPWWISERTRGIRDAAAALGLPKPLILSLPRLSVTNDGERTFQHQSRLVAGFLIEALRGTEAADGLLIASDGEIAPAAAACRLLGRQPGVDLDLVGYDDYWRGIPDLHFDPYRPEATIDRDGSAVGAALAALVRERLANPRSGPQQRLVAPRLVAGEAVGSSRPNDEKPRS